MEKRIRVVRNVLCSLLRVTRRWEGDGVLEGGSEGFEGEGREGQ